MAPPRRHPYRSGTGRILSMTRTHRRGSGFTLIELLVVIAIIAIIAAILFPVFAQTREKARQASCQSNVQNLARAILMYAQDYDEHLPLLTYPQHTGGALRWGALIEPY